MRKAAIDTRAFGLTRASDVPSNPLRACEARKKCFWVNGKFETNSIYGKPTVVFFSVSPSLTPFWPSLQTSDDRVHSQNIPLFCSLVLPRRQDGISPGCRKTSSVPIYTAWIRRRESLYYSGVLRKKTTGMTQESSIRVHLTNRRGYRDLAFHTMKKKKQLKTARRKAPWL